MDKVLNLSIHQLVDFLLRKGDIDNRVYNKDTMQEGSRLHAFYQSNQSPDYFSEYFLSDTFSVDDFTVNLEGRADGVILAEVPIVEEIKTTVASIQEFHTQQEQWHLGQAKCYALMLARKLKTNTICIRLKYFSQISKDDQAIYEYSFSQSELYDYVLDLIARYLSFYKFIFERTEKRNLSALELKFPYTKFRLGQKQLSKYAYSIAKSGGTLFCEAPTGIGKTVSTLFPYVKSWALGENEKIFYLTAKNSGKEAAFSCMEMLKEHSLFASEILITAKDKICFMPGKSCNPDECPFAKDYYGKVNRAIEEAVHNHSSFDKATIEKIALHHNICPFELELDLSLFVDVIICDYNYLFDPFVHMQRYFDEDASHQLVLIDEAHNLVDRGRDMYSVVVDSFYLKEIKSQFKTVELKKVKNALKRLTKSFNDIKKSYPEGNTEVQYLDDGVLKDLEYFNQTSLDLNKNHHNLQSEEFKEFSFEISRFLKLYDELDETSTLYYTIEGKKLKICIYCIDPSEKLRQSLNLVKARILFSATLSPIDYYVDVLGGNEETPVLLLPSPFKQENLCFMVAPTISTKYKSRDNTYTKVASFIKTFVDGKIGNYLVYFPSYEYLEKITPYLYFDKDTELLIQERGMEDFDKTVFLAKFVDKPDKTTVGLAIVGGSFSEGIDLVDERLIGVVVVGVGLPQICFEKDLVEDYYEQKSHKGFEYSYLNPGMNKVMQAVGRVIRSEHDRGAVLLIDERFMSSRYQELFKREWSNYDVVIDENDIKNNLDVFWKK